MSDIPNKDKLKKEKADKSKFEIPHFLKKTLLRKKPPKIRRKRKFIRQISIPENILTKLTHDSISLEELKKRILYVKAEFDNFKKRAEKEKENVIKLSNEKLLINFLPILDHFDLAIQSAQNSHNYDSLIEGIELIKKQFLEYLESSGLKPIKTIGESFDPSLHEAVAKVENDDVPELTVIEELRKGFTLFDKIIRPSMVKVSQKKKNNTQ